jgi:3-oxoacyl-[acyl-carrier-protein] synthase-1
MIMSAEVNPMQPCSISAYTLTCAAGSGLPAIRDSIRAARSGLSDTPWPDCDFPTWLGRVPELDEEPALPPRWNSRNNRLASLGLRNDEFVPRVDDAILEFGSSRLGVIIGTSTSSIGRTEAGFRSLDEENRFQPEYRQPEVHNPHSTAAYVADSLGIGGPTMTVSTACSSSAKVFASAARWLSSDLVDAVLVGGVDSLCLSVIYGFHSLQLVSSMPCRPFDRDRDGISLGEAAGFAIVTRQQSVASPISLLGYGESLDAYHMSSAHPEGLGARIAMQAAIDRSSLSFDQIDYLNLHGTGTRSNDSVEGKICSELFNDATMISATKGWTGHTLGAAGITEIVLAIDALATGLVPGTLNLELTDESLQLPILTENMQADITTVMSNSFGFGGNNCSVIFGSDSS